MQQKKADDETIPLFIHPKTSQDHKSFKDTRLSSTSHFFFPFDRRFIPLSHFLFRKRFSFFKFSHHVCFRIEEKNKQPLFFTFQKPQTRTKGVNIFTTVMRKENSWRKSCLMKLIEESKKQVLLHVNHRVKFIVVQKVKSKNCNWFVFVTLLRVTLNLELGVEFRRKENCSEALSILFPQKTFRFSPWM